MFEGHVAVNYHNLSRVYRRTTRFSAMVLREREIVSALAGKPKDMFQCQPFELLRDGGLLRKEVR